MPTTLELGCLEAGWADSVTPWVIWGQPGKRQPHTTARDPGCPAKQQAQHRCSDNGAPPPLGFHATSVTLMSSPMNPPKPCHMPLCCTGGHSVAALRGLSSHQARAPCPAPGDTATAVTGSTWGSEIAPVVSSFHPAVSPQPPVFSRRAHRLNQLCQTGSRRIRSEAVFTATPAPGSTVQETAVPAMSGRAGLLMLSRLSHAASS